MSAKSKTPFWDHTGTKNPIFYHCNVASVGIFYWVLAKNGKFLKKGKVVYRVRGFASNWEALKSRADYICAEANKRKLQCLPFTKKSETLGNGEPFPEAT
jgi:hypothetical protein